jgi:hypothetical protein
LKPPGVVSGEAVTFILGVIEVNPREHVLNVRACLKQHGGSCSRRQEASPYSRRSETIMDLSSCACSKIEGKRVAKLSLMHRTSSQKAVLRSSTTT